MAEFISLYSGSSGNSSVVRCGAQYLIVDMGKGVRTTTAALKSLGLAVSDCAGILVTHEHSDHVKGLSTFLKKTPLPVYGAAATLDFLDANDIVPANCELNALEGREEDIGCFGVQSFPTSHDVPCVGYRIHTPDDKTMTIATDLGTLTPPAVTLWRWKATTTCTCCAAGPTPTICAPASRACEDTFPTTSAPQSFWNSSRAAAKSLPCAISRRRITRPALPCRPCSPPWVQPVSCRKKTASCRHSAATR